MRIPKYRLHRATGQAVVTIPHPGGRKDYYLGPYNSLASRAEYQRLIAVYCSVGAVGLSAASGYTVREAVAAWTAQQLPSLGLRDRNHFAPILRMLLTLFGETRLADFGPVRFEALRAEFVAKGWSRNYVNAQAGKVKQYLRWLVSRELYPASQLAAIREIPGLRFGKCKAPERMKRVAVTDADTHRVLPHLSPSLRGLVLFQLYTGCRPSEALEAQRADLDTTGRVVLPNGQAKILPGLWVYCPAAHKSAWRGKPRYILIGPKGQAALAEFLSSDSPFLFPAPSGQSYKITSYSHAVAKACEKAGVPRWTPYQLRHAAGARIRDEFGEEHAQQVLGHAHLRMTSHYTSVGLEKAAEALRKAG